MLALLHAQFHSSFLPFVKRGQLDFWTQQNPGGTEIFQNQGAKKKRGERGTFESFIGGNCWRWNFKQKAKYQNEFKNAFMSYIINYLSNSSFLEFFQYKFL